ncbi:MAG: ribosome maturation factor RimM [Burkholderiaceae bacterium]|nr:ribosome maturation factor RimM [Burkholderiaceae bacterium]
MRGWLRIVPFNDPHDSILTGRPRWWLRGPAGCRQLEIEQARVHGDEIVAKARGVEGRDHALALKGCEVMISRAEFPGANEDEVYWVDLIGCTVRNREGELLGVVAAVEEFGADPVLRLEAPGDAPGRTIQRLVPLVPAHVVEVDLAGRRIVADWGLDY